MKKHFWIVPALALAMTACGGESTPVDSENESSGVAATGNASDMVVPEGFETTASGLQYRITGKGKGEKVQPQSFLLVHYKGTLADGTVFDESYTKGVPLWLALGQGMVIPGWDEGLALLHAGDKATLRIPSELAYGERGFSSVIPPHSDLTFEVEVVEIVGPFAPEESDYTTSETGLKMALVSGTEGQKAKAGDMVSVHYVGFLEDGRMFDTSHMKGQPYTFKLGEGRVIAGWDEAIANMKEGEKAQLVIPPSLGYGKQGSGRIPPDATLFFDVELVRVN